VTHVARLPVTQKSISSQESPFFALRALAKCLSVYSLQTSSAKHMQEDDTDAQYTPRNLKD
jgi:hypothetical protein